MTSVNRFSVISDFRVDGADSSAGRCARSPNGGATASGRTFSGWRLCRGSIAPGAGEVCAGVAGGAGAASATELYCEAVACLRLSAMRFAAKARRPTVSGSISAGGGAASNAEIAHGTSGSTVRALRIENDPDGPSIVSVDFFAVTGAVAGGGGAVGFAAT